MVGNRPHPRIEVLQNLSRLDKRDAELLLEYPQKSKRRERTRRLSSEQKIKNLQEGRASDYKIAQLA
ncbi:hypothetical protein Acsp01_89460 [Actinoplanes sp. NBRC 101535]|nr:hypothetical protein Acsp01_89460 [Actinoplanes sp. NBRC 101535]